MKGLVARFWAFLDRLFGPAPEEVEPTLYDIWCYWHDLAPGSPEEQEAWLNYALASMECWDQERAV